MDSLPSHPQAEGGDLSDRGEWEQGSAQGGRQIPSQPTPPPQVPLYNRCKALEYEDQGNEKVYEGPSGLEGSPRAE